MLNILCFHLLEVNTLSTSLMLMVLEVLPITKDSFKEAMTKVNVKG